MEFTKGTFLFVSKAHHTPLQCINDVY